MGNQRFDRSVLKVGQVAILFGVTLSFALGYVFRVGPAWVILAFLAAVMGAGVLSPSLNLFRALYLGILKPRGIVRPRVIEEDPSPHRFANALGSAFLAASALGVLLGFPWVGWGLAWVVICLAFANFAFDFCLGCHVYLWLARFQGPVPRQDR